MLEYPNRLGCDAIKKIKEAKQAWPLVVADMLQRNEEGAAKYNRYLCTDCPDDMFQHVYEELLDAAVYMKVCIEQNKKLRDKLQVASAQNQLYRETLHRRGSLE